MPCPVTLEPPSISLPLRATQELQAIKKFVCVHMCLSDFVHLISSVSRTNHISCRLSMILSSLTEPQSLTTIGHWHVLQSAPSPPLVQPPALFAVPHQKSPVIPKACPTKRPVPRTLQGSASPTKAGVSCMCFWHTSGCDKGWVRQTLLP